VSQGLTNDDKGAYLVTTATGSHYVLDLDNRTASWQMAATAPLVDFLEVGFSRLRRDGETLELLMVENCRVGEPAKLWLQVRNDAVVTLRTTSQVVQIERLVAANG
jgi:hypothetical protein